jgi:uncharacterized RDD family membrane protein YckC
MLWYYARNGQRLGPIEETELQRLAETGQLSGTDLVWKPGLPEWRPAGQMPELASLFRPAAPPPPPPPPASFPASPPAEFSPYAPPSAPLTSPPIYPAPMFGATATVEYASFWARFAAVLIDQVLMTCVSLVLVFFIGVVQAAGGGRDMSAVQSLINVISIVIVWVYYAGLESSSQMATFGKRLLGLKVTDLQGQRIDFGRATGRYFGKILSGLALLIGFFAMLWDDKSQTWHDKMAGCLVVKAR